MSANFRHPEDDFKGKEELERIRAKRKELMKANNSCGDCACGTKIFSQVRCRIKNKLVNTYNFCEQWKVKGI